MPGLCGYATKNVSRHIQQQSTHTFSLDTVHISHTVNVLPYICFTFTQGRIHEHATSVHAVAQSHIQGSEKKKKKQLKKINITRSVHADSVPESCGCSKYQITQQVKTVSLLHCNCTRKGRMQSMIYYTQVSLRKQFKKKFLI